MLITQPKTRIVEKIVRNKDGNFVRAYFLVAEFEGQIFWKLIKVEKESPRGVLKSGERTPLKGLLFLPIFSSPNFLKATSYQLKAIFSPYFLKTFFTSQMTRAPSKLI